MAKVFLKYAFIFDPTDVWSNKDAFEAGLGDYFHSKGLRAELIQSPNEDNEEMMVYLQKIESLAQLAPVSPLPKQKGVQKALKEMLRR